MSIELLNLEDGECVSYPLVLVDCQVHDVDEMPAHVHVHIRGGASTVWPLTAGGHCKALVHLPRLGEHQVSLVVEDDDGAVHVEYSLELTYAPRETAFQLRFYYLKTCDSDGSFDAPQGEDNSLASAVERVRFNALLMQSMMAELMHDHGFGRETFAIQVDSDDGQPIVHVLTASFSTDDAHVPGLDEGDLFDMINTDLEAQGLLANPTHKHAILVGCSHFDAAAQAPRAHIALGSSSVACFGSCGLHTWAPHVGDVTARFLDTRKIDASALMDDSNDRATHWANYATGVGAFFHEVGHALGLGHAVDGLMNRGIDDFNQLVCVYQPHDYDGREDDDEMLAPATTDEQADGALTIDLDQVDELDGTGGAFLHRANALLLHRSLWLHDDVAVPRSMTRPTIQFRSNVCGPVGYATDDGEQMPFGDDNDEIVAFWIQSSDASVERVTQLTRDALDDLDDDADDDVFVLADDDVLVQLEVVAVAWVDALRLTTRDGRVSRWFGAAADDDADVAVLAAPAGSYFRSLFGSHGDDNVGRIGAFVTPMPASQPDDEEDADIEWPPLVGVIVETNDGDGRVTSLASFDNVEELDVPVGARVFLLGRGETLVQIDLCRNDDDDVVGLCVHTNRRSSPWYGDLTDHESFEIAAPGECFVRVAWTEGDDGVDVDIGMIDDFCMPRDIDDDVIADVIIDDGEPNIVVSSDAGLAFVFTSVNNKGADVVGDMDADHVFEMPGDGSKDAPWPMTWRLSFPMFLHHVQDDKDAIMYGLCAVDATGAEREALCLDMFV
ncbi:Aste57867_22133 [Aphanomyces stellatus]|uniref:Aste57867_22133 protein n=1 Tax=Aphanomyces stellatus TaxID=120398 RepID=A0A485LK74_9STRA|nr:hypothetical protein As57867_022064 [Aphanomyces stellatus]VFT98801.1 Aste57867_22133 [Aphanomyces stellatus]